MHPRTVLSSFFDILFPVRRVSGRSWASISPAYFEMTASRACQDAVLSRANAFALFSYNDPLVKEAMHDLKYHGAREVAELFGSLIAEHLQEELSDHMLLADTLPLLIPIPVTFGRYIERSYNQTELIAREAALRLPQHVEYAPDVFSREAFHGSNALAPTRRERAQNVRGAFIVTDAERVEDRDVILLDDIITTGATTHEAAATLLSCGARSVSCVAVAH